MIIIFSQSTATRPAFDFIYPTLRPRLLNNGLLDNGRHLFYPYDRSDYRNEINSMKQFHDQPLPFRLPFFGFAFHYIWVTTKSNLTMLN